MDSDVWCFHVSTIWELLKKVCSKVNQKSDEKNKVLKKKHLFFSQIIFIVVEDLICDQMKQQWMTWLWKVSGNNIKKNVFLN